MTAKEFLSQIRQIDQLIDTKLEQISKLHSQATKATSTLSDIPQSGTHDPHALENIIVKMLDLEADINKDVDRLVDLKREIMEVLKAVRTPAYQALLEMRYFGYMTWNMIAEVCGYDIRSAYRDHKRALRAVESILRQREGN